MGIRMRMVAFLLVLLSIHSSFGGIMDNGLDQETDFEPLNDNLRSSDKVSASDDHQVTVTAKFWYVSDFQGDAESLANTYAEEMNAALARSNIPITYIRWGAVQMLPVTHADIVTEGSSMPDRHRNFINSLGAQEENRLTLKQSADHIVVMTNYFRGAFGCLIFGPWEQGYTQYYPTITISINMTGTFTHEAGHCLGAMHDRITMGIPDDSNYNYGYCLPDSPYSTIMAYYSNCPAPERTRILHFSNPDILYEGIPTGDEQNNNARAITEDRDKTSKYGRNCYDGNPDKDGNMVNQCKVSEWSSWSSWSTCCCVDWDDRKTCPSVPLLHVVPSTTCKRCVSYLVHQQARNKTRTCLNILNENVYIKNCPDQDWDGDTLYETRNCDCSETTTTTTSTTTTTTTSEMDSTKTTTCAAEGKFREKVNVKKGESYIFKTNQGNKYGPNVDCRVIYKKAKSCRVMWMRCSKFKVETGDVLKVTTGMLPQRFKKKKGPNFYTHAKRIKVSFKSNNKKHGEGATCKVSCSK